ncbi:MAG: apolipoprotein N-acyltransferase [Candidatus Adiutrix sp.]|jgi:apolipoprotein N-acyltransferase|nr:apolipoprotein N-acyltransferase [Candidatus Adiutrix sp.]
MPDARYRGQKGLSFTTERPRFWVGLILAAGGGLTQAASWFRPDLWMLSLVAVTPLIMAAVGQKGRRGFFFGWIYGLSLSLAALPWLADVLAGYGGLGSTAGWAILFGLACYLALYQGIFGWLVSRRLKSPFCWAILGSVAWCGLDWLKNWVFTGFNWTPLAGPLALSPFLGQAADLFGFYGLGFFAALANFCLALILLRRQAGGAALAGPLLLFILLLSAGFGYGLVQYDKWTAASLAAPEATVAVIQPSEDQNLKWNPDERAALLGRHLALVRQATRLKPWAIIWPETAMPFFFDQDYRETEWLKNLSSAVEAPMLVGVGGVSGRWPEAAMHNRMILLQNGEPGPYYDKMHLVPFGEYLPLDWLPFLKWAFMQGLLGAAGAYSPGQTRPPVELPAPPGRPSADRVRLGILICFESIFPDLGRERILAGADLLVVPTNDGWFGRSRAPRQHLWQSIMRAIETRRPLVRVGNTGISAAIRPSGQTTFESGLYDIGAFPLKTPLLRPEDRVQTIFVRYGFMWSPLTAILTCLTALQRLFCRTPKTD